MLEKLTVRNFQAHAKLPVPLDGITTIVGPSDVGKSSVIRALRWLALNKPRGSAFVRQGAAKASVSLRVDGRRVVRRTGGYILDGKPFSAVGTEVPKEIRELLRMEALNFQDQHDPPFWLSLSPPELSRQLNDVVDLGLIDKAMSALATKIRSARAERTIVESRLTEGRADEEKLRGVQKADEGLALLEQREKNLEELSVRTEGLAHLTEEVRELSTRSRRGDKILRSLEGVEHAMLALEEWDVRARGLERMLEEVKSLATKIRSAAVKLASLNTKFQKAMGQSCPLCGQSVPQSQRSS